MSVTLVVNNYIEPVYREPAVLPMITPAITHRWHNQMQLTGDASGGNYLATGSFAQVSGQFGQHGLWDIKFLSISMTASLIGGSATLFINTYERSTDAVNYIEYWRGLVFNNQHLYAEQELPDYRWKFKNGGLINIYINPNTNGTIAIISMGGYIYDERMI